MTGRKLIIAAVVAVVIIALAVGVYSTYNPTASAFFPKCPFKLLTGLSCPGCGMQRALHALLNGHPAEALSYNYFFILSLPYALAIVVAYVCRQLHRAPRLVRLLEDRRGIYAYCVAFVAWFVIRNVFSL